MRVASSLISGLHASTELVELAVRTALSKARLTRAEQVILLLSESFNKNPQAAVLAAARTAGTTQISGCTTHGVFTEDAWQIDQPAVAALVLSTDDSTIDQGSPVLSLSGNTNLPSEWHSGTPRAGLLNAHGTVWHHGRLCNELHAEIQLPGLRCQTLLNRGLRILGDPCCIDEVNGYELRSIDNQSALDCLTRNLPASLREHPPLHHLAILQNTQTPSIAILSANADGSLSTAQTLNQGESIQWAIRQPLFAEQEVREALSATVDGTKTPNFAMMFSCIGRGPLFYGNDDRDQQVFREQFPGIPLIGGYGSGQIAFSGGCNHLFNNALITLLFEEIDV